MRYAGGIDVVRPEFAAVQCPQHKDMPDFDAPHRHKFRVAFGAAITGFGQGNIRHNIGFKVTRVIDIFDMRIRFIAARDEIGAGIYGVVSNNHDTLQPDRGSRAGNNPLFCYFGVGGQT